MSDLTKPRRRSKPRAGHIAGAAAPEKPRPSAAPPEPSEPTVADPIDAGNLDEAFVKALEADFRQHGATAIHAMRAERPTDYVKLVAAVRGKDAHAAGNRLQEMSDDELDSYIRERAARCGYEIRVVGAGIGPGRGRPAPHEGADGD